MSVEAPKPVEETPVVEPTTKALPETPVESSTAPAETTATTAEPTAEATPAAPAEESTEATPATEEVKKDETVVTAVPASEGVLGYKEPTLLKRFFFTKHFFWFSEEPSTPESLATFLRSEKVDAKHASASWARETGKGLLFFSKRAEDKASPVGIINLADASTVTKEGFNQFSFKAGNHHHRFEATKAEERDSWVVAVEKAIEEAKGLKEEITGRESYKKNVEEYSKPAVIAPASTRSKSKEPKKSLEVNAATAAATTPAAETTSPSTETAEEPKKELKERSQSRKRGSIFGSLMGKKEEHAEKKEEKKEVKEEKSEEAEAKKEESKETEEPSKAVEAGEAAAVAAVPAVAASTDKKEEKEEAAAPTEKKNKRGSVFGTLFKKNVTSPTTEKTEKEATGSTDVPPVSETAPKLEEPIENKPIDTAAVTAPVDTVETPSAEEATKEPAAATGESAAPKTEKKGGLMSFIKKTEAKLEGKKEHKEEAKEESKEDKAAEAIAKDPVAAASAEPTTETAATEPATETPAAKEERPARDNKRRTSLFFNKKRDTTATSDAEEGAEEPKREKSPTPAKFIGNLVRRASKAVKSEGPKEKEKAPEPAATAEETPEEAPAAAPEAAAAETEIKGDVVPSDLVTDKPEPAVPAAAPEVKATA
ncbi:uncharacterized protein PV06_10009 [Exophiala oligosperma]|uniref:PH domain-containing protein n=1 Tax=Exophiala oligosperma TaxID=215243 RepID=A0A0D2D487_9EURO|nr:uncharacterized protein PV06_10009 [Exophiala oligosperma]KIW38033.1 hypothetical protein PV06_10009 [Exophiala oligosperma]